MTEHLLPVMRLFLEALLLDNDTKKDIERRLMSGDGFGDVMDQYIKDASWQDLLEAHVGLPFVRLEGRSLQVPQGWTFREALHQHVGEYRDMEGAVVVSAAPLSDEVSSRLKRDSGLKFVLGDAQEIDVGLLRQRFQGGGQSKKITGTPFSLNEESSDLDGLIRELIWQALVRRASDIHLEENDQASVRLRMDGRLLPLWTLDGGLMAQMINRLKLLSGMNLGERVLPQDGRFTAVTDEGLLDVRTAALMPRTGEKMVLRLLPRQFRARRLEALGLSESGAERLRELSKALHGLLVFSGPTNSGKTTLLYTLLSDICTRPLSVYSIEDPIEAAVDGVSQIQINTSRHFDYEEALRGVLRMDPDVVMVGELRDEKSARMAVRAALTGHLVLTTLHTYDAQSVVSRLEDLGVSRELLANGLLAVINQRLMAAACPDCAGSGKAADGFCTACGGSGRRGRLLVHECWEMDDIARADIRSGLDPLRLREQAVARGFETLADDVRQKLAEGRLIADEWMQAQNGGEGHGSLPL